MATSNEKEPEEFECPGCEATILDFENICSECGKEFEIDVDGFRFRERRRMARDFCRKYPGEYNVQEVREIFVVGRTTVYDIRKELKEQETAVKTYMRRYPNEAIVSIAECWTRPLSVIERLDNEIKAEKEETEKREKRNAEIQDQYRREIDKTTPHHCPKCGYTTFRSGKCDNCDTELVPGDMPEMVHHCPVCECRTSEPGPCSNKCAKEVLRIKDLSDEDFALERNMTVTAELWGEMREEVKTLEPCQRDALRMVLSEIDDGPTPTPTVVGFPDAVPCGCGILSAAKRTDLIREIDGSASPIYYCSGCGQSVVIFKESVVANNTAESLEPIDEDVITEHEKEIIEYTAEKSVDYFIDITVPEIAKHFGVKEMSIRELMVKAKIRDVLVHGGTIEDDQEELEIERVERSAAELQNAAAFKALPDEERAPEVEAQDIVDKTTKLLNEYWDLILNATYLAERCHIQPSVAKTILETVETNRVLDIIKNRSWFSVLADKIREMDVSEVKVASEAMAKINGAMEYARQYKGRSNLPQAMVYYYKLTERVAGNIIKVVELMDVLDKPAADPEPMTPGQTEFAKYLKDRGEPWSSDHPENLEIPPSFSPDIDLDTLFETKLEAAKELDPVKEVIVGVPVGYLYSLECSNCGHKAPYPIERGKSVDGFINNTECVKCGCKKLTRPVKDRDQV